ncbi:MAG: type II toxin-antitoxin system RelE/ParE family toxin [Bacteroidales bacterium]|nr:type II toxin-antitoxin system RelE/ParE family toxin [Bacteroidales bacterium]
MKKFRKVISYKRSLYNFLKDQQPKIREKIIWVIKLIEHLERIPTEYIKHIQDTKGLYEIRIIFGSDIIRIFCCFDTGKIIVLLSGFVKKTQKTPKREIEKALKLMKEYYEEKERH